MKRSLACVLGLCVALTPVLANEQSDEPELSDYAQGKLDGKEEAEGRGIWILSGLFLGPVGLVLPWIFTPEVPGGSFVGKSADYVEGYQDGYKVRAKVGNFMYSLTGFAIFTGVVGGVLLTVAAVSAAGEATSSCLDSA